MTEVEPPEGRWRQRASVRPNSMRAFSHCLEGAATWSDTLSRTDSSRTWHLFLWNWELNWEVNKEIQAFATSCANESRPTRLRQSVRNASLIGCARQMQKKTLCRRS